MFINVAQIYIEISVAKMARLIPKGLVPAWLDKFGPKVTITGPADKKAQKMFRPSVYITVNSVKASSY